MASYSFSSPIQRSLYDVFLSFYGSDTRNFTSHLLDALNQQSFSTFYDQAKLQIGEDIRYQLPKAISQSRVSIIVFSMNYASSGWCLDELVKIMEFKSDFKQIVLPIFYDVDPSDVRYRKGFYAKAFEKHEDRFKGTTTSMERVERWREALTQAANLSGWHLQNVVNRNEGKLIKIVVNEVVNRLDQLYCDVADHPVGVDSRVQELKGMLKLESDDVTIVAVWGVGGIGKTTIAKALFNSIRNKFEGSSFLADVGETTKTSSGVVILQKQLLSNILRNDTHSLDNYHQGIDLIKRKLCHQRVLLVLDDVDHVQQLIMLAIKRDLFCAGSKIIITTRNKSSLTSIQVDSLYEPVELNAVESLKLFSWNAFNRDHPEEGYSELSQGVVAYAVGLPLALEVLGSSFASIRNRAEWESSLNKLRKHLPRDILGKLKIIFDSLDKNDQDLFLDIAFFFVGRDKDFAVKVLEDSECFPEIGIGELARRRLIQVDKFSKLRMHKLLSEMAKEIVYQESSKEPRKSSRLIRGHKDVLDVLRDSIGREAIEGLYLELPELNNEDIDVAAFADMRNVRLLHLNYLCHLRGTNITMSRKLKWLCWHQFPLSRIPDDLYMENLVAIDLQNSRLKQIWKGPKRLDKLRFLNLSHSYNLIETPDFSGLNNLEELLLHDCRNLVKVDYSIGFLDKLVILNMANCRSVRKFPSSIFLLTSLQLLDLSGCSLFEGGESRGLFYMLRRLLPNYQECMAISTLSLQALSDLRYLNLSQCNLSYVSSASGNLNCLQRLSLSQCSLSNVPIEIGNLTSLRHLDLSGNKFSSIPSTLRNLACLIYLNLKDCDKLTHLPLLPSNLFSFWAENCLPLDLETVERQFGGAREMRFKGCTKLDDKKIERDIIQVTQDDMQAGIYIFCGELPLDMDFYGNGSSTFSFVVPPDMGQNIRGWILRAVFYMPINTSVCYEIFNKTKVTRAKYGMGGVRLWHRVESNKEVGLVSYAENGFNLEGGDELEFVIVHITRATLKKCGRLWGIKLIYEGDDKPLKLKD